MPVMLTEQDKNKHEKESLPDRKAIITLSTAVSSNWPLFSLSGCALSELNNAPGARLLISNTGDDSLQIITL